MGNKIHIGIDVGQEGAIVALYPDGKIERHFFPFIGDEYDIFEMNKILKDYHESGNVHIVIEDVKALQRPLDRANWSLSGCKHILITICAINQIPYTLVAAKAWQKVMFQGVPMHRKASKEDKNGKMREGAIETKIMSALACKRLFPTFDLRRSDRAKKDHDGVSDALCMAEYSRRHFD